MSNHLEGESCSDVGRVLVLNDPLLRSFVSLAATRGTALPACYPALWRAARGLDPHSFLDVNWCNMFHAYLIHTELVSAEDKTRDKAGFCFRRTTRPTLNRLLLLLVVRHVYVCTFTLQYSHAPILLRVLLPDDPPVR
jgi:hypothetical protein